MTRRNMAQKLLVPVFALLTAFVFLTADLNTQAQNSNSATIEAAAPQAGNTSGSPGAEHDMSGTFTGTIDAPALNLSGPATITFTTNTVSISTEGGGSASGTYFAREWPGEIAVSIRFGTTLPADIYSLRARHRGESLTLRNVRGESKQFWFTTGGGGGGGARRRGRRGRRAAQPVPEATPEATPPPSSN
jgi:hypothetical protein